MQDFVDALRVKDNSIFDLLHHTFYERDFLFFIRLAKHLGERTGCEEQKAIELGKLSQLLYLSSVLHFSITEATTDTQILRAEKQMPVLLGDLLYGRFISALTATGNTAYLPIYLTYLKQFNANGVDHLEGRMAFDLDDAAVLLMKKTAEIFAVVLHQDAVAVLTDAEQYFAEEWIASKREKVTNMTELEGLFDLRV